MSSLPRTPKLLWFMSSPSRVVFHAIDVPIYPLLPTPNAHAAGSQSSPPINAGDAAEFLAITRASFNRLAPSLPRISVSNKRFVYLHDDLLEWLGANREAPVVVV